MAPPKLRKWARNHNRCKVCGTTEIEHWARGYCKRCYKGVRFYREYIKPMREKAKKAKK